MYNYSVFDTHCDTLCRILDSEKKTDIRSNKFNIDVDRMKLYREYTQVFACFIAPEYKADAMDRFRRLAACYHSQDFSGIHPMLSIEDGSMINSLSDISYLKREGVRTIALTWNGSNQLGGGVDDPNTGLTDFGKDVVREMNNQGILVDVSHLNDKTFYDVASITAAPLVATHSNSRAICSHKRNLTDDMFKIIVDSGGCVGINLYRRFVSDGKDCTLDDVMRHIDHFAQLGGIKNIGIGADFDGVDDELPDGVRGCEDLYKLFDMISEEYGVTDTSRITNSNFKRIFDKDWRLY